MAKEKLSMIEREDAIRQSGKGEMLDRMTRYLHRTIRESFERALNHSGSEFVEGDTFRNAGGAIMQHGKPSEENSMIQTMWIGSTRDSVYFQNTRGEVQMIRNMNEFKDILKIHFAIDFSEIPQDTKDSNPEE